MPDYPELKNPYSAEDYDRLCRGEKHCVDGLAMCEQCERAGMDVIPQREAFRAMRDRYQKIHSVFFPNGRPQQ